MSDNILQEYLSIILFTSVPLWFTWLHLPQIQRQKLSQLRKVYHGSCHCKSITFEVEAPRHLVVWDCNCSICYMKKNWHFIVPDVNFKLTSDSSAITEYRFNTKTAKHVFCKNCGVQSYYTPRSNPDGKAVTLACVDIDEIESFEIRKYDGRNWESFFNIANISHFSKE